jgi:hypothetical protein
LVSVFGFVILSKVVVSRSEATTQSKDPLPLTGTSGLNGSLQWLSLFYNPPVPETALTRLDRVLAQLRLYEHPLLNFSAHAKGEGVEVIIQFKDASIPVHTYYFDLHPRDLDHPQFEWSFQRQLYDALHDYFVEMFIRTPQDRADRREKDL